MNVIRDIFDLAGSLICHQLPERSLTAGGIVLPVCARDTGIYTGIMTAFVFLLLARRLKAQKPPALVVAIVMVVMMIPMMADGALSYTGFIETNNTTRLFTGLLFGLPIPFLLVPAANFRIHRHNECAVLKRWYELVTVCLAGAVLAVLLLNGLVPYIAAGLIFITGFLSLISRLAYTIFARAGVNGRPRLYGLTLLGTISVLTLLYIFSAFVLHPLRIFLTVQ